MSGKPTFADLFAGIGGFRLGLERAGWQCKWSCEIDPFCRKVYAQNFGKEPEYGDIREIKKAPYVDMLCGGFPCQPFSVAGKQLGADDDRNLWPEMLRIVKIVRPMWILGENVPGIGDYTDTICADLEAAGYEVLPLDIPACVFGAKHIRYRRWFISHAKCQCCSTGAEQSRREKGPDVSRSCAGPVVANPESAKGRRIFKCEISTNFRASCQDVADTDQSGRNGRSRMFRPRWGTELANSRQWATEPDVGRVAHGVPDRVDRLKSLGNAVVPQVVEWIGKRIIENL